MYYGDYSMFDSSMGEAWEAPKLGTQVIAQKDEETGRTHPRRWDWYYHTKDGWWGTDVHGLLDQFMLRAKDIDAVLMGRTIPTKDYEKIVSMALKDKDFPLASSINKNEMPKQAWGEGKNGR